MWPFKTKEIELAKFLLRNIKSQFNYFDANNFLESGVGRLEDIDSDVIDYLCQSLYLYYLHQDLIYNQHEFNGKEVVNSIAKLDPLIDWSVISRINGVSQNAIQREFETKCHTWMYGHLNIDENSNFEKGQLDGLLAIVKRHQYYYSFAERTSTYRRFSCVLLGEVEKIIIAGELHYAERMLVRLVLILFDLYDDLKTVKCLSHSADEAIDFKKFYDFYHSDNLSDLIYFCSSLLSQSPKKTSFPILYDYIDVLEGDIKECISSMRAIYRALYSVNL